LPLTPTEKRAIKRKVDKLIKDNIKLEGRAAKDFARLLRRTRNRIQGEIIGAEAWEAAYLSRIKDSIDTHIISFRDTMRDQLNDTELQSWMQGISSVDEPFGIAKIDIGIPAAVSEEQLLALQSGTEELITGLSGDMRSKVRVALDQAILGEMTPSQASKRVNSILGVMGDRGEKIVRTEVGTAFSIAGQIRKEQAQEVVPKLKKQWLTFIDARTRPSHIKINGQIREVDKPYKLYNDRTGSWEYPMYPRDPVLEASNRVHCRCDSVAYMEEWQE